MDYENFKQAIQEKQKDNRNSFLEHLMELIYKEIEKNAKKVQEDLGLHSRERLAIPYRAGIKTEVGLKAGHSTIAFSSNHYDEITVIKRDKGTQTSLAKLSYDGDRDLQNSVTNDTYIVDRDTLYFLSKI